MYNPKPVNCIHKAPPILPVTNNTEEIPATKKPRRDHYMNNPERIYVFSYQYKQAHHYQYNDGSSSFCFSENTGIFSIAQFVPHVSHVIISHIPDDGEKRIGNSNNNDPCSE